MAGAVSSCQDHHKQQDRVAHAGMRLGFKGGPQHCLCKGRAPALYAVGLLWGCCSCLCEHAVLLSHCAAGVLHVVLVRGNEGGGCWWWWCARGGGGSIAGGTLKIGRHGLMQLCCCCCCWRPVLRCTVAATLLHFYIVFMATGKVSLPKTALLAPPVLLLYRRCAAGGAPLAAGHHWRRCQVLQALHPHQQQTQQQQLLQQQLGGHTRCMPRCRCSCWQKSSTAACSPLLETAWASHMMLVLR
jgi:hypothetical protein